MAAAAARDRPSVADLVQGMRLLLRYERPRRGQPSPLWHERLLLEEVDSSTWVVVSPTIDVYAEDVLDPEVEVAVVGPRGGLPPGLRGQAFRLDEDELDAHQGYIEASAEAVLAAERAALARAPRANAGAGAQNALVAAGGGGGGRGGGGGGGNDGGGSESEC